MKVKYSLWRDMVMGIGLACVMVAGWLVGKQYFNRVLNEILSPPVVGGPRTIWIRVD